MITVDQVRRAMPPKLRGAATQELADKINQASSDPDVARNIRDNFISYTSVLNDGKFKTEDYLNAVMYVSYKLIGYSNKEAYARTFPQRYQDMIARGSTDKDISSFVAAYNKNKLVNAILEQTLVPTWVLNQDLYQKAINVQAELMLDDSVSAKVRTDAANSLLTHLKRPEAQQVELSISHKDSSGIEELNETLRKLAVQQQEVIKSGVTTQQIAHQRIIDTTPVDVTEAEIIEDE